MLAASIIRIWETAVSEMDSASVRYTGWRGRPTVIQQWTAASQLDILIANVSAYLMIFSYAGLTNCYNPKAITPLPCSLPAFCHPCWKIGSHLVHKGGNHLADLRVAPLLSCWGSACHPPAVRPHHAADGEGADRDDDVRFRHHLRARALSDVRDFAVTVHLRERRTADLVPHLTGRHREAE